MQYVIAYDVADDERRNKLATTLLNYGKRIQRSVFVADLDDQLAHKMREEAIRLTDPHLDALHIFTLCRQCQQRSEGYGAGPPVADPDFYVL